MIYNGLFSSKEDICQQFQIDSFDGAVLYSFYEYEDYSGTAHVLFMNGSKLYYVEAGHCSCAGLEETWSPEETSVTEILHQAREGRGFWHAQSRFAEVLGQIGDRGLARDPDEVLAVLQLMM